MGRLLSVSVALGNPAATRTYIVEDDTVALENPVATTCRGRPVEKKRNTLAERAGANVPSSLWM